MTVRKYSSRSQQTTLSSPITSTATTMTVVNGASIMGGKTLTGTQTYTVVIDPDTALEEIVDVTLYSSGNTLTITRGVDGPTPGTGLAHSAGAVVRHMAIGRDYQEANDHIEASTSVHGITGSVVGTGGAQTLTDKTLTSPALNTPTIDGLSVQEKVEDIVGAMVSSNTESGIAVTYDDATGKLNFDVSDPTITLSGDVTGSATITNLGNATITTTISAGTIVNADINAAAAIDKTKISGTAITAGDTGTVTSTMIADGTIVNADVNASAQIAYGKLNLTNSVTNADINASAAIEWTKIAPSSTVSATELGYLDGVTSAVQTQLDSKLATATAASTYAPLASPALTGVPTAPTATAGTNTTQVATTAFVKTAVDNVIAAAPGALDTLDELAAALGDDANFATTVTNNLATKLPLAGGTMSGAIAMGTNKITGMGNPTLAQDAATKYYVDNIVLAPSNLTGPITSVGNVTSVASQTGTGSTFVMNTSPTLVTPVLGVATATSINGTTIPTSKTLVATDSTTYVVPSQTGNAGKFLTTNGTTSSWSNSITGALGVGEGTDSTSAVLQLGNGRTADGNAYIDLIGDTTYTDFGLRIIRSSGANGTASMQYRGTGGFSINAVDAGAVTIATSNLTRMTVSSGGNVGIAATPNAGTSLIIGANTTGQTSYTGVYLNPTISADTTSQYRSVMSVPATAAAAFTLTTLRHFFANGVTVGAGSAVGTQVGYYAESNITGATANYGFQSTIAASGSANWNFYASGTAPNYFAGRTGIGATLTSGAMAQVVNTTAADVGFIIKGAASQTGDLLQVQNSAGTSLFEVDSTGRLLVNLTTSNGPDVEVVNRNGGNGTIVARGSSATDVVVIQAQSSDFYSGPSYRMTGISQHGASSTGTTAGLTNSGLGMLIFQNASAALIGSNNSVPIVFAPGYVERMRIDASGNVGIGTTVMSGKLNVDGDAGGLSAYLTDGTNSSLAVANLVGGVTLGTDSGGAIHLATNGYASGNRRLSIDASGNTTINTIAAGTTSTAAVGGGYMGLPQNSTTTGAYTVVAADAGKHIYSTATRTVTIDSNANLALPIGTTLTFIAGSGATVTIAITTDTMYLAGAGTTGSRTLAAFGMATAVKIASTTWMISGNGLT